jgi:hypothetical protein
VVAGRDKFPPRRSARGPAAHQLVATTNPILPGHRTRTPPVTTTWMFVAVWTPSRTATWMLVTVAAPSVRGEVDLNAPRPARGLIEHCTTRFADVKHPWIGALQ